MQNSPCARAVHALPLILVSCCLGAAVSSCGKGVQSEAPPVKPAVSKTPVKPPAQTTVPGAPKVSFKRPDVVKGIYLTAWSAGTPHLLDRFLKLEDATELNAMVIDVRDNGEVYFPTHVKLAEKVQGNKNLAVPKPEKLMEKLAQHNVWPIARIACFRDRYVPVRFPAQAVQYPDGKPWHDRSGHYWLDPYDKRNWNYIAQIVDYAMDIGFPEIQLDYVRFPSEGKSSSQVYPNKATYPDKKAKPEDVVAAFADFIGKRVRDRHCAFSADIFGIISSSKSDQGIGQELEKVAGPFDVVSPMVYPSHFALGEYGIKNPNKAPYEIVLKSLRDYKKRIPNKIVRPWLQAFSLGGVHYGGDEIRAQIKAAREAGYDGFLLWNAGNKYTDAGLKSQSAGEADQQPVTKAPAEPTQASQINK
ncbi:MAG TPA: putative glycoside hydrolase [Fimbriimonas sp.]|nr:putative glycoside hydrolase [Fimbriimonas sp.]